MTQADLEKFRNNAPGLPRSTTVFHEAGLRTLLLHLKAGEKIPEHQTRGAIVVHCVGGRGSFSVGGEQTELREGVLISVPASVPHALAANEHEELLILVVISEPAADPQ
jgi:quercetin dioxygenase-like cupin family protein